VPKFCRHNRLIQNCPICSREQDVELRPILSPSAPRTSEPRPRPPGAPARRERSGRGAARDGVTVRRLRESADDSYRSSLVPGLKSSEEARRLAAELAFAADRMRILAQDPPGLYAEVAGGADVEERTWLAFLIAYLCPLETGEDPFAAIRPVRTSWASGELPELDAVETGPRTAHDPARGTATLEAYRAWAQRSGSQAAAFGGEPSWSPERRFARAFERISLPGLHRDARFDLLVTLGLVAGYELRAGALQLGGGDQVTIGAKRALGIGDSMLLERRAAELARACGVPLEALDLAFYNWERGQRATMGLAPGEEPRPEAVAAASEALGL
jgi:hypothetical protein